MKVGKKKAITIIRQYKALRTREPDKHIEYCVKQQNLVHTIELAAKAIDEQDKIHSHQRRVGKVKLNSFAALLVFKENKIRQAKNFDELLSIIKDVKYNGVGTLTYYDTAIRIGAYLNLFPDKIYLHAGTKVGASKLLGKIRGKKTIEIDELPQEFTIHNLTASQLEDILCIFKDDF